MGRQSRLSEIVAKLRETTVMSNTCIDNNTELYYDLKISGFDLYEFLLWFSSTYDVDFGENFPIYKYAPNEGANPDSQGYGVFSRIPYKRLPVSSLLDAIEKGRWVEE